MAQIDISAFEFFLPILAFLVVFFIAFFALKKSKLIENAFTESLLAFILAIILISASGPRTFILAIIPWFAVVLIAMFLVLALGGFLGKDAFPKGIGKIFMWVLLAIFIITAFFVFSAYVTPYLPGFSNLPGNPGSPAILRMLSWLYSPQVAGALLVLGVGAVVSWYLIKAK